MTKESYHASGRRGIDMGLEARLKMQAILRPGLHDYLCQNDDTVFSGLAPWAACDLWSLAGPKKLACSSWPFGSSTKHKPPCSLIVSLPACAVDLMCNPILIRK